MKNKSWFDILLDLAVMLFLAWATIHYMHLMNAAKEEIEVVRNGFTATLCMIGLAATCIVSRVENFLDK